jgi:hypothetical protein
MTTSALDYSATPLPAKIQENIISFMRMFAGLPGIVTTDATETFWIVSNRPAPGNMILRVRWPMERIEERIDELFATIGSHIDKIDWMVFPGDQPYDLGRRLEDRGMPGTSGGNWLWADLALPSAVCSYPHRFHVEQMHDDKGICGGRFRASETHLA